MSGDKTYNIVIGTIFGLFFALLIGVYIHSHNQPDKMYRNIEMKIVSINGETQLSNDKFHRPQTCNVILLETLTEHKLYREINTCELDYTKIHINTEWIYNHKPGDTVHFDYLRKDSFFKIYNK